MALARKGTPRLFGSIGAQLAPANPDFALVEVDRAQPTRSLSTTSSAKLPIGPGEGGPFDQNEREVLCRKRLRPAQRCRALIALM